MTIHGPGTPIWMSEIATEFGKYGDPYYLSSYYAGGGLVPAGTLGYYGAIPSSGALHLSWFYGASRSPTIVFGQGSSPTNYGWKEDIGIGSLTPQTAWPFGSNRIIAFYFQSNLVQLHVENNLPNSGWTNVDMPGKGGYNRASATYISGGGITIWRWSTPTNAFVPNGATSLVNFT